MLTFVQPNITCKMVLTSLITMQYLKNLNGLELNLIFIVSLHC